MTHLSVLFGWYWRQTGFLFFVCDLFYAGDMENIFSFNLFLSPLLLHFVCCDVITKQWVFIMQLQK